VITEIELRLKGVGILSDSLGLVDAERFLSIMQKEPFDYTQWQKNLFSGLSVEELSAKSRDYRNKKESRLATC
jgi:hypothetical protein